ncbi:MAG: response regulator, partial [Rhizobacter sp.]|nr:response regulator [Chlorobiales bacterium]
SAELHSEDATGLDDGSSVPLLSENESLDDPFTTALDDAFSEPTTLDDSASGDFTLDDSIPDEAATSDVKPQETRPAAKDKPAVKPQRKFEPNEIQKIFLEEASEYLEKLNQDLFALDKNVGTHDAERIGSVLRSSHTIKGSAAMVQLRHISELAHKMEDTLQLVRDNKLKVQRVLIDVLVQATDTISAMLGKFQQTGDDGIDGQENLSKTLLNYADQLKKNGQIAAAGESVMPSEQEAIAEGAESIRQFREKFVSTVAEQTVRIDITTLNNLVNLSAELVIARNRLSTELSVVYKTINKFIKERAMLTQFSKKLGTTIQKQTGGKLGAGEGGTRLGDVLSEFSDTEFDRFSEFDILSRDIKSAMLNFDEAIKDMRTNTSTLNQNIVRVSGIANDLNREIVSMRMVPVKQMFTRFNRSLRDIAKQESKELNLITEGEDTKLDKTVMEEVIEPVMHLVRNSIGHGIETPDIRVAQGKPPAGTLTMRAYQKGNQIILEVQDDGAGLNIDRIKQKAVQKGLITEAESLVMPAAEATELIFRAGFSTADQVTELQGRGVGMDVVRSTIRRLKGSVNVESAKGKGTKFIISLPLTLAIGNALLVEVMAFTYAMPLDIVLETANISTDTIEQIEDKRYITIRGEKIELRYLNDILGYESDALLFRAKLPVVVIEMDDQKIAVGVERLLGKEEIVVKTLGKHLRNVRGITGSTILGDGQVVIILDFNYLLKSAAQKDKDIYVKIEAVEADVVAEEVVVMPEATKRKRKGQKITVLAADDSPSVRKYIQSVLQQADINVVSADDGLNALNKLAAANADIVVTDLEMPRMNGFELVSEIRKLPQYDDLPIVIVTARAGEKHRRTGLELGASAFLNKPFDPRQLIETIESFVA